MRNSSEILTKELINFVLRESGDPNYKLSGDTCLIRDLGMNGEDGVELMIAYGKEFNVNLSEFATDKYFEVEGLQFIDSFLEKVHLRKKN